MGCDIHSYVEVKTGEEGEWSWDHINFQPFDWRQYGMYAFLAGVRNYSAVKPIAGPRGVPDAIGWWVNVEIERWKSDGHTHSWLLVKELLDFDYDALMEDRRHGVEIMPGLYSGAETCPAGLGKKETWREFLGPRFFRDLAMLKEAGDPSKVRVVFWFDN